MAANPDTTELTRGKTKQAQPGQGRTHRRGHTCKSSPCTTWLAECDAGSVAAARSQFARTFADVLAGRFGGSWSVEWQGANGPAPSANRDRRAFSDKK